MTDTNLINGKLVSNEIILQIRKDLDNFKSKDKPTLAIINVGDNIESQVYINMKIKRCNEIGVQTIVKRYLNSVTDEMLINSIHELNHNSAVNGILVQLPLPKHINTRKVLSNISLEKDVDGFHVKNMGKLVLNNDPLFIPCTAEAVMELFKYYKISLSGKLIVVVGTSSLVGLPLSLLCLHEKATIIMTNSKTKNLKILTKQADIIIACCGQMEMITEEYISKDVIIIDIGINKKPNNTRRSGYELVGDVNFVSVQNKTKNVNKLTIGPITIAILIRNTVKSFIKYQKTSLQFNNNPINYTQYM